MVSSPCLPACLSDPWALWFTFFFQWYNHSRPHKMTRTGVDGKPRLPVPVMLSFGAVAGLVAQVGMTWTGSAVQHSK